MQIYLVQHGESKPEEIDPERRLTETGARAVQKVADFLRRSGGMEVDAIWHSGKPRAQQTAELLRPATRAGEGAVMQHDGLAPKDAVEPIKRQLEQGNSNVMIVGHLPFLGRLAALLLTGNADKEVVAFQFGCVVCLNRGDAGKWKLEWMMVPKLLSG
jgi:phosphohistidine phosphatase